MTMGIAKGNLLIFYSFIFIALIVTINFCPPDLTLISRAAWTYPDGYDPHGGYLDHVTFVFYAPEDEQLGLQALQAGLIYAWDEHVPIDNIMELEATTGLEVTSEPGDMYRMFCLNCGQFPTNNTGYRRALAYALDKFAVVQANTGGLAFVQDCAIPLALANWTFESQLTETYYNRDITTANATLEAAWFRDLDGNGWRDYDADNSSTLSPSDILDVDFAIEAIYFEGHAPSRNALQHAVHGLNLCGIMAEVAPYEFYTFLEYITKQEYWLASFTFTNIDSVDLLYDYFHSSTANNKWYWGGWINTTYDIAAEGLMASTTESEANEWAWKCQKILWEEQPMIVCYNDVYTHAYRTDRWEGYVNMATRNRIGNGYSLVHIRLKESDGGPFGCIPTEYIMSLQEGLDTTNWLMSNSEHTRKIFQLVYEGLWTISPFDWTPQPALAYTWEIQPTTASGDIQDGEKYTFHLYDNATWHDGIPVTAEDVAFSLTLGLLDPYRAGNYENIYRVNSVDSKTVELYSNKTGYFEWFRSTGFTVYPAHIWSIPGNITAWEPTIFDLVGSGPYSFANYIQGQYIELERNPAWHFAVEMPPRILCTHSQPDPSLLIASLGLTVIIIQLGILVYLLRRRERSKSKHSNHLWMV